MNRLKQGTVSHVNYFHITRNLQLLWLVLGIVLGVDRVTTGLEFVPVKTPGLHPTVPCVGVYKPEFRIAKLDHFDSESKYYFSKF